MAGSKEAKRKAKVHRRTEKRLDFADKLILLGAKFALGANADGPILLLYMELTNSNYSEAFHRSSSLISQIALQRLKR